MISTVTSKGQVTIPKAIRDLLHIKPNDKVDFIRQGERIILVPVKTLKDIRGIITASGKPDFDEERKAAKTAVGKRVAKEME